MSKDEDDVLWGDESFTPSGNLPYYENDPPDASRHDVETAIKSAHSLTNLQDKLYEIGGEFDESPLPHGTERTVQAAMRLAEHARDGVSLTHVEPDIDEFPPNVRGHVTALYRNALADDTDEDIIES